MSNSKIRKYFLSPVTIVPNGRLHLGHVSGPLLKMDVLCRYLRSEGHEVTFISSSDPHESHVDVRAFLEGKSPEEIANFYHKQIVEDLKSLSIEYDLFVNPLSSLYYESYKEINIELMNQLILSKNTYTKKERIPYLESNEQPIMGGWIQGQCPDCTANVVSLFCESCGAHFAPQDIKNLKYRFSDETPKWRNVETIWLKADKDKLLNSFSKQRIPEKFVSIFRKYVDKNGPTIRLTHPANWGLFYPRNRHESQAMYTYSAVLLGCHLFSGKISQQKGFTNINPFSKDSDITTVISFGIDNTIPFLLGAMGIGFSQNVYKGPDKYFCNYFYYLDGKKFSTNRRHVIWASDICKNGQASPDIVRAYLAKTSPEEDISNFCVNEFVEYYNKLLNLIKDNICQRHALVKSQPSSTFDQVFNRFMKKRQNYMSFENFSLSSLEKLVREWLTLKPKFTENLSDLYPWYLSFAIFSYPILPSMSLAVWQQCGQSGIPSRDRLYDIQPKEKVLLDLTSINIGNPISKQKIYECFA